MKRIIVSVLTLILTLSVGLFVACAPQAKPSTTLTLNKTSLSVEKYMNAFPSADAIAVNVGGGTDISGLSADVRKIKEQGERRTYTDASGNVVMVYKNLTRRVVR